MKLLTDKYAAAVLHTESGILKVLRVFEIDNHAPAAHEKAGILLQRRGKRLEGLPRGQRLSRGGVDIDHMGEVLGTDDVPIAQTDLSSLYPQLHEFLRLGNTGEKLIRQRVDLPFGKGLDQIVQRADLKSLQRMIGGGRGKHQKAVRVGFPQRPCRLHTGHALHINIQKSGGETPLFFCREKRLAAVKFQKLRLRAPPRQLPCQLLPQQRPLAGKVVHNGDPHAPSPPPCPGFKLIIPQRTVGGETRMVEFVPKSRHSCRGT